LIRFIFHVTQIPMSHTPTPEFGDQALTSLTKPLKSEKVLVLGLLVQLSFMIYTQAPCICHYVKLGFMDGM